MINRENILWLVGIGLSLLLHASLFIQSGAQFGIENANEINAPLLTRLNFYQQATIQTEEVQKNTPRQPAIKQSDALLESDIKKKEIEPIVETIEQELAQSMPQNQGQLSENNEAMLAEKQQVYMQRLLAHIENRKYYPRSARRRGIEGSVLVSFELLADGSIKLLHVTGAQSVLQKATRQAVQSSIPLPLPPSELNVPKKIEFSIQYLLQ